MMISRWFIPLLLAALTVVPAWAAQDQLASDPLLPLPPPAAQDPRKVDLGRRLFHDPILSRDGTVSCASCHQVGEGGDDGRSVSVGVGGALGGVNAPTVYNADLNVAQFWDGRAANLHEQAGGPIVNPLEMAANWPDLLHTLGKSPYAQDFARLYDGPISAAMVQDAIAAYERTLITTGSRFDRWLGGEKSALTATERQGYQLFQAYGCASCHQGANVGGNLFQRFGFFGSPFADRGHENTADLGRFNVTGTPQDRYVFKVPSLRLVTRTAPYFHDGSVSDLHDAIRLMGLYQLGQDIPDQHIDLIIGFLGTLIPSGQLPR